MSFSEFCISECGRFSGRQTGFPHFLLSVSLFAQIMGRGGIVGKTLGETLKLLLFIVNYSPLFPTIFPTNYGDPSHSSSFAQVSCPPWFLRGFQEFMEYRVITPPEEIPNDGW